MDKQKQTELWALYHENSKLSPHLSQKKPLSEKEIAELMLKGKKSYPIASKVPLETPSRDRSASLASILLQRRSTRVYSAKEIPFARISELLRLSYGVSGQSSIKARGASHCYELRTAPSAGALFACELYLLALNVEKLKKGVYHYFPEQNNLETLRLREDADKLFNESIVEPGQFQQVAAALVITGTFAGAISKYGARGYRYVLLDAGHIGQNIYLTATALNLGVVGVCGFYDDKVNDLLFLRGEGESALYVLLLGMLEDE